METNGWVRGASLNDGCGITGFARFPMKRNLLIVFPSYHLSYSPTTINLYDALAQHFEVTILAPLPPYPVRRLENRRVDYVRVPYVAFRLAESVNYRLKRFFGWNPQLGRWLVALLLLPAAYRHTCDEAIGVDFLGTWIVQKVFGSGQMMSLEIEEDDPFQKRVDIGRIHSLIIQTETRYDYLFKNTGLKCFLVQNAPVYHRSIENRTPTKQDTELLYCGSAAPGFGIYRCLDFLVRYPDFRMTIQGAVSEDVRRTMDRLYSSLVTSGRVTINGTYLEGSNLFEYLSQFAIGLCCYDLSMPGMDTFNYRTAPSGKLFSYYAAGVPVIGSDIRGLDSVKEFDTGVLIPEFTPEAIREAIETVRSAHPRMRANCLRAARHFSFDEAIKPYIAFVAAPKDRVKG